MKRNVTPNWFPLDRELKNRIFRSFNFNLTRIQHLTHRSIILDRKSWLFFYFSHPPRLISINFNFNLTRIHHRSIILDRKSWLFFYFSHPSRLISCIVDPSHVSSWRCNDDDAFSILHNLPIPCPFSFSLPSLLPSSMEHYLPRLNKEGHGLDKCKAII